MRAKSGNSNIPPVLWGVFLWIIVPIGLFFGGYKFVGPKIGEVPALSKQATDLLANKTTPSEKPVTTTTANTDTDSDKGGPEVEVTVEKSGRGTSRRSSREETPKPRKKKKPAVKAETKPARDAASTDGALGGGDGPRDPAGGGEG